MKDTKEKKVETKNAAKKSRTSSSTRKKATNSKKSTTLAKKEKFLNYNSAEYYDLPYRYNQTVIKILSQTPNALFIYWDVSDSDKKEMLKKYGENFFNETKPVLFVHNKTLNMDYEIEVNDFTNSWYLHTQASNCVFNIELGRKRIVKNENSNSNVNDNILHIASSNVLQSPNDHILKDTLKTVRFKNIKTNEFEERDVSNFIDFNNLVKLYNDENNIKNNPSSGFKIS